MRLINAESVCYLHGWISIGMPGSLVFGLVNERLQMLKSSEASCWFAPIVTVLQLKNAITKICLVILLQSCLHICLASAFLASIRLSIGRRPVLHGLLFRGPM